MIKPLKDHSTTLILLILLLPCALAGKAANKPLAANADTIIYDIRTFGAVGDGTTLNTKAIQAAIDCCSSNGGVVLIAKGNYVTGTLYLKSNIVLRLEAGAVLMGSRSLADYATNTDRTMYNEPYMDRCLIFARNVDNISIEGQGVIDGQGSYFPEKGDPVLNRPKMIRLIGCSHIRMSGITLRSPASWNSEWRYCSDIAVDNIHISSRNIPSGDGLDFDGCVKVRVSNSVFDTGDDCLCLQTSSPANPCRDFVISGCSFSSRWAGIRIGLLSRGDFKNVLVTNCIFSNTNDAGIKIQMLEGAEMKNLVFSKLTMRNVPRPVFVTFNRENAWVDAQGEPPPMKRMHDMVFDSISVDNSTGGRDCAFIITGLPGHPVEDVTLRNIKAIFPGGGTTTDAGNILAEFTPENLKGSWPEYYALRATMPAYGIYLRHVKGVTIKNAGFTVSATDARPAVLFLDVSHANVINAPEPDKR